ncbi:WXG100 family type VII secretion target [Mycobacteriaceae bacterium NPDC060252]
MEPYRVDCDDLLNFVVKLQRFAERAEEATEDADKIIMSLHESWSGEAASAQMAHHQMWTRAASEMHGALDDLRKAAQLAHNNYTGAVQTNSEMWPKV